MTKNQERALLPLISLLRAHDVDLCTIDEVMRYGLVPATGYGL